MFFGGRPKEKGPDKDDSNSETTSAPAATAADPLGAADAAKSADVATSASCTTPESHPELDHEEAKRSATAAQGVSAIFGEVVALLMRTPPYKELWLTDLEWLVVPALLSGQVSVATAQSTNGVTMTVGAVLWACVSDEVDKRLAAEPRETIRLAHKEWTSGDIVWIVASAGDGRVLGEMLKRLSTKEWADKDVRIMVRAKDGKPKVAHLAAGSAEAA